MMTLRERIDEKLKTPSGYEIVYPDNMMKGVKYLLIDDSNTNYIVRYKGYINIEDSKGSIEILDKNDKIKEQRIILPTDSFYKYKLKTFALDKVIDDNTKIEISYNKSIPSSKNYSFSLYVFRKDIESGTNKFRLVTADPTKNVISGEFSKFYKTYKKFIGKELDKETYNDILKDWSKL